MTDQTDAQKLLAERVSVYGNRVRNMERVAQLWTALLGVEILDWQVPLLMSAYKMLRTFETPDYSDNSDDIDGWKEMFVEVMNENYGGLVKARTVEEFRRLKKQAERAEREGSGNPYRNVPDEDEAFTTAAEIQRLRHLDQTDGQLIDAWQEQEVERLSAEGHL